MHFHNKLNTEAAWSTKVLGPVAILKLTKDFFHNYYTDDAFESQSHEQLSTNNNKTYTYNYTIFLFFIVSLYFSMSESVQFSAHNFDK